MMDNNVPSLRFKEFGGAWEKYKFKDLYEFKSTNSLSRDKLNYEIPNVRNIHYGDIHVKFKSWFNIEKEIVPYINLDINLAKISEDNYVKEGDVIIADASENYEDIGKSIEIINLNNEKVLSGLHTFLARKKTKLNYNGFMTFIFKSERYRKQIHKIAQGTKVLSLSSSRVGETTFEIPTVAEQEKIANYLSALDEKINLLSEKEKNLAQYKKAMMQKLFAQEIRFKDDEGKAFEDWKEKKLGEVAEIKMGQSPDSNSYNEEGLGVPLIQGNADIKNRVSTPRQFTTKATKFCEENDILFTVRAPVGYIGKANIRACIGRGIAALRPYNISDYIYQYLLFIENKWASLSQGSTFTAINSNDLKQYNLPYPCVAEQEKIGNFLSAIDEKIEKVKRQLEEMQAFKKGMLQQLFV